MKPIDWITNEKDIIKQEYHAVYVSTDESDGEVEAGDIDTKFTYAKTNSNQKPQYSCSDCDKMFCDSQELRNHTSNHHKEIYKCLKCNNISRTIRSFFNHYDTHQKPPNQCPVETCSMTFDRKSSLTNHLQKHSDFRMTCEKCGKKFQYRQSYLEHIEYRHRPTKTVPCPVCKRYYWTPTSMRSHRAKVHGLVSDIYDDV